MQPHQTLNPGIFGAIVSLFTLLYSFMVKTLPIIQWCGAALGGIAAILSITWTLTQIRHRRK